LIGGKAPLLLEKRAEVNSITRKTELTLSAMRQKTVLVSGIFVNNCKRRRNQLHALVNLNGKVQMEA